ncbi:MAG: hypothetical protein HYW25_00075 [Candidatus Aenigmarchaeota archaeon]|nr:hypothetical protein [Candidatus Aenigmarchaeota archaeon]
MIFIVDNGRGAGNISRIIRSSKIVKTNSIPVADAYIISDGETNGANQKNVVNFLKKCTKPVLAIGAGYLHMGVAFGAVVTGGGCAKTERIEIKQRCPILLDFKKNFTASHNQKSVLQNLPEEFGIIASSPKNEYEIIQHGTNPDNPIEALPFFGVHFNPEEGLDGVNILHNFERFVEMWNKYH